MARMAVSVAVFVAVLATGSAIALETLPGQAGSLSGIKRIDLRILGGQALDPFDPQRLQMDWRRKVQAVGIEVTGVAGELAEGSDARIVVRIRPSQTRLEIHRRATLDRKSDPVVAVVYVLANHDECDPNDDAVHECMSARVDDAARLLDKLVTDLGTAAQATAD